MINSDITSKIENYLKIRITKTEIPPQGMDSNIFLITDNTGKEYAVKLSKSTLSEKLVYELLAKHNIDIPLPKLIYSFTYKNMQIIVLEKVNFPLLDSIPTDQIYKYIPSMIENLKKVHQVKSDQAGFIASTSKDKTWKELLLTLFNNNQESLNWNEIVLRNSLDQDLVTQSVKNIVKKIKITKFTDTNYSLLHTDFNQRNLFVNPNSNDITGIIDWAESMFGDPIYDFARVRMLIWHFEIEDQILKEYYQLLSFSPKKRELEELYWVIRIIEYLAYYSEDLNEFNKGRIDLHQNFLKTYDWKLN